MICGKCIVEGYIKPNSVQIINYSCANLKASNAVFHVLFKCDVCFPVAGMKLKCIAKNITKAGIKAESAEDDGNPSPFILYVARDFAYANDVFNSITVGQEFIAKVIEQRFELNDTSITIMAQIDSSFEREQRKEKSRENFKPSIQF
jgi:hypothetical protein